MGEHPSLASLREYLLKEGESDPTVSTKTVGHENDDPLGAEVATPSATYLCSMILDDHSIPESTVHSHTHRLSFGLWRAKTC